LKFCIAPDLLASRSDYLVGVVVARLVDNRRHADDSSTVLLRQAEAMILQQRTDSLRSSLWRSALEQFGIDVRQHPPAIDRLLERVRGGQPMPPVNPAVDLANAVALRHHVSLGVHDLDAVKGDITVRLGARRRQLSALW